MKLSTAYFFFTLTLITLVEEIFIDLSTSPAAPVLIKDVQRRLDLIDFTLPRKDFEGVQFADFTESVRLVCANDSSLAITPDGGMILIVSMVDE